MARKITSLKARNIYKARLMMGMVLKPLRLFCDHCDKYIPSDMEWRCGHCHFENTGTRIYSFLNKCKECKRAPKAVVCPHDDCGGINFLDKARIDTHPARKIIRIIVPTKQEARNERREDRLSEHIERKEELAYQIEEVKLNAELARLKESSEFNLEVKAMRKLERDFSEHDAHFMGVKKIAKRREEKINEEFKNDAHGKEEALDSLNYWKEKNS
jgi:hypothetical protein